MAQLWKLTEMRKRLVCLTFLMTFTFIAMGEYEVTIELEKERYFLGEPIKIKTTIRKGDGVAIVKSGFSWGHGFTYEYAKVDGEFVNVLSSLKSDVQSPPVGIDDFYYDPQRLHYSKVSHVGVQRTDLLVPGETGIYRFRASLMDLEETILVSSGEVTIKVIPIAIKDQICRILTQDQILKMGQTISMLSFESDEGHRPWLQGTGKESYFQIYEQAIKECPESIFLEFMALGRIAFMIANIRHVGQLQYSEEEIAGAIAEFEKMYPESSLPPLLRRNRAAAAFWNAYHRSKDSPDEALKKAIATIKDLMISDPDEPRYPEFVEIREKIEELELKE